MGFTESDKAIDGTPLDPSANAIPCGLVAKTWFNDTFTMKINNKDVTIDETDISFAKDRDLFKKNLDTLQKESEEANKELWMLRDTRMM